MGLGTGEIVLIFVVVMVVFGASKLPQLGDGLGRAIKNFKRAVTSANEIEVSPKKPEVDGSDTSAKPDPSKPGDKVG
jgi:sec-independent protein translocase protein TatA